MVKQLRTDEGLFIALDLCRPHYQVLLIIYLKKLNSDKCKHCKSELDYVSVKDNN